MSGYRVSTRQTHAASSGHHKSTTCLIDSATNSCFCDGSAPPIGCTSASVRTRKSRSRALMKSLIRDLYPSLGSIRSPSMTWRSVSTWTRSWRYSISRDHYRLLREPTLGGAKACVGPDHGYQRAALTLSAVRPYAQLQHRLQYPL